MNVRKMSNFIFSTLQFCIVVAVILLDYFSKKKMGVMRYVVYKNRELQITLFNPQFLLIYKIILIVFAILSIITIILTFTKDKYLNCRSTSIITILVVILGILYSFFSNSLNLKSQYFFFVSILIIVLIQYLKLVITISSSIRNKNKG